MKKKSNVLEQKYCKYCDKNDHNTEECWSTHSVWSEEPIRIILTDQLTEYKGEKTLLNKAVEGILK